MTARQVSLQMFYAPHQLRQRAPIAALTSARNRLLLLLLSACLIWHMECTGCFAADPAETGAFFAQNLLGNASVEDGASDANGVPKVSGWEMVGSDDAHGLQWRSGQGYSGSHCLAINASQAEAAFDGSGGGVYWRSVPVPCQPGAVYQAMGFLHVNPEATFLYNPLELVFFTKEGKRIDPLVKIPHNKEIHRSIPLRKAEWNLIMTRPLPAPDNAATVSLEFKGMNKHHFAFHQDGVYYYYHQDELLLDNVALWKTASQQPAYHVQPDGKTIGRLINQTGNFDKYLTITLLENRPPQLPAGDKRENSVYATVGADTPGRILSGTGKTVAFDAALYNLLSIPRALSVDYQIFDWLGASVAKGTSEPITVSAYQKKTYQLQLPCPPLDGAYAVEFHIKESGKPVYSGQFGFGIRNRPLAHLQQDLESTGYPFAFFEEVSPWMDPEEIKVRTALLKQAGTPFIAEYLTINWFRPTMTDAEMDTRLEETYRKKVELNRQLREQGFRFATTAGILPGHMDAAGLQRYRVFWQKLTAMLDYVDRWGYGNETIGGTQTDPDKIYRVKGMWKFEGNVRDFFEGYRAAREGAKSIRPDTDFILTFHNDSNAVAIRHAYNVGGIRNDLFDGLGINCYNTLLSLWKENVQVLTEHGAASKPLYVPEVGEKVAWSEDIVTRKKSELQQAINLPKMYLLALSRYPTLRTISYFKLVGSPQGDGLGVTNGMDNCSPYTAYMAYPVMTSILGARKALRIEKSGYNNVAVWTRERDGKDVLIAWGPGSIRVQASAGLQITDLMGTLTTQNRPDGIYTVALSDRPVYLEGEQLRLYADQTVSLTANLAPLQPEGGVCVTLTAKNLCNRPLIGDLAAIARTPNAQPHLFPATSILPGQSVQLQADLPSGSSSVQLLMRQNDGTIELSEASISPTLALKAIARPALDGSWIGWDRRAAITLGQGQLRASASPWNGEGDLSATVWLNWSEDALYIGALVKDDKYFPSSGSPNGHLALYRGDAIEMGILSESKQMELDLGQADGKGVAEQTIPVTRVLPEVEVFCHRDESAGTTCYQARLPWTLLNLDTVTAGKKIALALAIADKDFDHDRPPEKGLKFNDGIWGTKSPELFGDVALVQMENRHTTVRDNVTAEGFHVDTGHSILRLQPALKAQTRVVLAGMTKTENPLDLELLRADVTENTLYRLAGTLNAHNGESVTVRWLDEDGTDLGAKAVLFGFPDSTLRAPAGDGSIAIVGSAPAQAKVGLVVLSVPPTAYPTPFSASAENFSLQKVQK